MTNKDEQLLSFLDKCPPFICREMAFVSGKRLKERKSLTAIAVDAGLRQRTVERISIFTSWKGVKIGVASKFIIGCNVEILNSHPKHGQKQAKMTRYNFCKFYLEKNMPHLTDNQRARFYELLQKWQEAKK